MRVVRVQGCLPALLFLLLVGGLLALAVTAGAVFFVLALVVMVAGGVARWLSGKAPRPPGAPGTPRRAPGAARDMVIEAEGGTRAPEPTPGPPREGPPA